MTTTRIPLGQPVPGASLGQSIGRFLRGYFWFSGRASRSEFWWAMVFVWLLSLATVVPAMLLAMQMQGWSQPGGTALLTPDAAQSTVTTFFALIIASASVSLLLTIPTYAVMWRRLQDANFHGAWILLSFIGLAIVPLIMCFLPSNPAGARFGPPAPAPAQPTFGFGASGYDSPAAMRERMHGTPVAPPAAPAGAGQFGGASYGGLSYGGATYGGTPYGGTPYGTPSDQQ